MKKIICTALAILLAIPMFSQEPEISKKEQRKVQKELKKEKQAEEAANKAALVELMVEYRRFVLEADRLRDKRGVTANVASNLNFVASDSITGVIQIGSYQYVGSNGVGGITVEGSISNYEYSKNEKNGTWMVSYNVRSSTGTYDVRMTVFPDGRAEATVSSNWPGRVNYLGYLVPPASSRVWKGTTRY
jgi:hypothetical protein